MSKGVLIVLAIVLAAVFIPAIAEVIGAAIVILFHIWAACVIALIMYFLLAEAFKAIFGIATGKDIEKTWNFA